MPDRPKKPKLFIVSVVIFFTFDQAAPGADFLNLKLVIMKQIPYYTNYMNSDVFQLH